MGKRKRGATKRNVRNNLWTKQGGLCFWCELPMELFHKVPNGYRNPRLCTIDHIFDKFTPMRRIPTPGERRRVAACWECNQKRAITRSKQYANRRPLS